MGSVNLLWRWGELVEMNTCNLHLEVIEINMRKCNLKSKIYTIYLFASQQEGSGIELNLGSFCFRSGNPQFRQEILQNHRNIC